MGYPGTPAEIHHIRRYGGLRNDSPVIPLCPEHHRGKTGVHGLGRKAFERLHNISEDDLLETVNTLIGANHG